MPAILNVQRQRVDKESLANPWLPGLEVFRVGNRVGESPVWDDTLQALLWIDIRAPELLMLTPDDLELTRWRLDALPGAIGLGRPGQVVMTLGAQVVTFDLNRALFSVLASIPGEPPGNRMNDGKVSPSGRWFVFGSMDDSAHPKSPTGALYCVGADAVVRRLAAGLVVTNGIAWNPAGDCLYFSDSDRGTVWTSSWDEEAGGMGTPRRFASSRGSQGRPDGALVTSDGDYLSAGVSAGCLNRFDRNGRLLNRVPMPCRAPTMPCYGGRALEHLYITSLVRPGWVGSQSPSYDGDLFRFKASRAGDVGPRFRV
ncbi:MAG: SMP-30/gluconolactonase/LRE family protein [Rhizobacter sp.]|nr:SMP-30/gluconolactonase/LRE family protein [Rhizobacter sp.]